MERGDESEGMRWADGMQISIIIFEAPRKSSQSKSTHRWIHSACLDTSVSFVMKYFFHFYFSLSSATRDAALKRKLTSLFTP